MKQDKCIKKEGIASIRRIDAIHIHRLKSTHLTILDAMTEAYVELGFRRVLDTRVIETIFRYAPALHPTKDVSELSIAQMRELLGLLAIELSHYILDKCGISDAAELWLESAENLIKSKPTFGDTNEN